MEITLQTNPNDIFNTVNRPAWYPEAVSYLRGNKDEGLFGLYLYHLIREIDSISTVVNIGTARGHSAVCAAKALAEAGRPGTVHTIDIIHPDETRSWHENHAKSDPLVGTEMTMRALVSQFHDSDSENIPIEFHTGDSSTVLQRWNRDAPDLVFHDGKHDYETVSTDIEAANTVGENRPIHVFDDCHLYAPTRDFRPFAEGVPEAIQWIPKVNGLANVLREFSLSRSPYPGVDRAVEEAMDEPWSRAQIIFDDHAPITTLYPEAKDPRQVASSTIAENRS